MRGNARLVLPPLISAELVLLENVLNKKTGAELSKLTNNAIKLAVRSANGLGRSWSMEVVSTWKKWTAGNYRNLEGNWIFARKALVEFIGKKKPGVLIDGLPLIGIPSRTASVAAFHPEHLIRWLVFRGIANRQLGRFVECDYCGRWGLRKRARLTLRYCSEKCQSEAHLESIKRSQNAAPEFVGPAHSRRSSKLDGAAKDAFRLKQIGDTENRLAKNKSLPAALQHEKDALEWRLNPHQFRNRRRKLLRVGSKNVI